MNLANLIKELGEKTLTCESHGDYRSVGRIFSKTEIWTNCPDCEAQKTEMLVAEEKAKEAEARRRRLIDFYKTAGLIKRYWGVTLNKFKPKENQMQAYQSAKKFVSSFDEMSEKGQCLIFCGGVGTGKTMLVHAIIQTLGHGLYIRAIDISREVRASYSNDNSERDVIDYFVEPDLLVIDEAGLQQGTENEQLLISDIIDRRYGDLKTTIICSNLNEKQLSETFGKRAWDRLKQNCLVCPVIGESQRRRLINE